MINQKKKRNYYEKWDYFLKSFVNKKCFGKSTNINFDGYNHKYKNI